ncbi:MAG: type III pantothenate kinase [Filifactoraceae bacterium]
MLMVFDVGNTNMVFGTYKGEELTSSFRIGTDKSKTSDEYGVIIKELLSTEDIMLKDIKAVIISSVVPEVMHSLENFSAKFCKCRPMIVGAGIKTGINIKAENPQQVGADRVVNAVAAMAKYKPPLIIIDFGTATTFCAVDSEGNYLGGAIAPGVKIGADALFQKASKLHKIELVTPKFAIGKNTTLAMQSGIIYGYAGLVEKMVSMMKSELREEEVTVIATGGLAGLICQETKVVDAIERNLTLEGLRIIYNRNVE